MHSPISKDYQDLIRRTAEDKTAKESGVPHIHAFDPNSPDSMQQLFFPHTIPVRDSLISTYVILQKLAILTGSFYRLILSHDRLLQESGFGSHPTPTGFLPHQLGALEKDYFSAALREFCEELPTLRSQYSSSTHVMKHSESCMATQSPNSSSAPETPSMEPNSPAGLPLTPSETAEGHLETYEISVPTPNWIDEVVPPAQPNEEIF